MRNGLMVTGLLLLSAFGARADYKVLHVKGDIYNETRNKAIALGDVIADADVIKVRSDQAFCYVFHTEQKSKFALNTESRQLAGKITDLFSLLPVRKAITSRGDENEKIIKLGDYFGAESYVFLDSIEHVMLDPGYFDLSGASNFVVKVTHEDETLKSILDVKDGRLVIDLSKALKGNEWQHFSVDFFQVNASTGEFKKLSHIHARFLDLKQIEAEINNLRSTLGPDLSEEAMNQEISVFLSDIYGMHNFSVLSRQLSKIN